MEDGVQSGRDLDAGSRGIIHDLCFDGLILILEVDDGMYLVRIDLVFHWHDRRSL